MTAKYKYAGDLQGRRILVPLIRTAMISTISVRACSSGEARATHSNSSGERAPVSPMETIDNLANIGRYRASSLSAVE